VVKESLRQLCLWNNHGATNGTGVEWWNYVAEFMERCEDQGYFTDPNCIKDAYKHAKVDSNVIDRCMQDSGGTDLDNQNEKLDSELMSQEQRGVVIIPTAFVNGAAIRGSVMGGRVLTAICSSYSEGTTPAICSQCVSCPDPVVCESNGRCTNSSSSSNRSTSSSDIGVSMHTFASSMLLVIAGFAGSVMWQYKKTREDMRNEFREILAGYMLLEDNDMHMNTESPIFSSLGEVQAEMIDAMIPHSQLLLKVHLRRKQSLQNISHYSLSLCIRLKIFDCRTATCLNTFERECVDWNHIIHKSIKIKHIRFG
jgi:hypothetical protein